MENLNKINNIEYEYDYQEKYEEILFKLKNNIEIDESQLTLHDREIYKLATYTIERCLDGIIFTERIEEVSRYHNRREYPLENGIGISPLELGLSGSKLDTNNINNYNLHHNSWTKYKFGKDILYRVLRQLENNQFSLPIDTHASL